MTRPPAADTLHLAIHHDSYQPRLQIEINGQDLTELQQPPGHSGSPLRFQSPPCKDVLPPDAVGLLPTTRPTQALIAVCTCGEAGCNSLWITVHRNGARVVWEPDPGSPRHTIDRTWEFELQPYLDQIDTAVADYHRTEPRGHPIARELRRRQASLFGFGMGTREYAYQLCSAFPGWLTRGSDHQTALGIEVAGPDGIAWYTVPLPSDRTDNDILDELSSFHPERYQQNGLLPWVRNHPNRSRPSPTAPPARTNTPAPAASSWSSTPPNSDASRT